jgi:hypothetical protein
VPSCGTPDDYAVVIVDSASHFWRAKGGTLDIADGKYGGWKEARPAQDDLVQGILSSPSHVIVCARSKMKHEQRQEKGRWVVDKLGMEAVQDSTSNTKLNVSLTLDMDHTLTVAKSRTIAVPVGRTFAPGHATEFAEAYREWLAGGEPPAPGHVVKELTDALNALPPAARKSAKGEFVARFGKPDQLRENQVDEARTFVAGLGDHHPDSVLPDDQEGDVA